MSKGIALNILAIDSKPDQLDALERAIRAVEPDAELTSFLDAETALDWPGLASVQVAFLEAKLVGLDGVSFARELQKQNPSVNIIFVSGHSLFMREAFDLHASGFIVKPVSAERIRFELDSLRFPLVRSSAAPSQVSSPLLYARCFGNFEAFAAGKPLVCRSLQAIELLAYLIDRRGTYCHVKDVEAALWEGKPYTAARMSQVRNLVASLSRCLNEAGCEDVLLRQYGHIGLDTRLVSCDYWDYLDGKPGASGLFHGEYMTQYPWAEHTLSNLS